MWRSGEPGGMQEVLIAVKEGGRQHLSLGHYNKHTGKWYDHADNCAEVSVSAWADAPSLPDREVPGSRQHVHECIVVWPKETDIGVAAAKAGYRAGRALGDIVAARAYRCLERALGEDHKAQVRVDIDVAACASCCWSEIALER